MLRTRGFVQDEHGQWWRYWSSGAHRTRGEVRQCHGCDNQFVTVPSQPRYWCSRKCWASSIVDDGVRRGENSPHWKGGRRLSRGYVQVWAPDHPSRVGSKKKYVLEHRLVMEKVLGRYLEAHESVHHRNGVKHDNRPENLELWSSPGHLGGIRVSDSAPHCPTCTCGGH